jgi:hypothetical protein
MVPKRTFIELAARRRRRVTCRPPARWRWRCRWNGPAPAHQKPPRTPQKSWIYRGSSFSAMYLAAAERPLAFIRLRSVRLGLGWAHTACRAPGQIRVPSSPATRSSLPVSRSMPLHAWSPSLLAGPGSQCATIRPVSVLVSPHGFQNATSASVGGND